MCSQRVSGASTPSDLAPRRARLLPRRPSLVAIGNFDGVHRGHRAVIAQALSRAGGAGLAPVILTFDPHPALVVGRGALPALTLLERKLELLGRQSEALSVAVEPFTTELARTEPVDFVEQLLVEQLDAKLVLVGENFRFGRGRSGDFALLEALGRARGFEALAASLECDEQGAISSTRIRKALEQGALEEAERLLGRPHAVSGSVVPGQGRGRTIGVPTANLSPPGEALPPHGVYAVLVDRRLSHGFSALGTGVANFGVRPTLGAGPSFEVHLFDVDQDLYGQELRVHLVSRLREERKFGSLDELVAQIGRDVATARELTRGRKPDPSAHGAWY